ncbi:MAG: Glyoxylate reductase [Firmicutes bacterium]|nr:Glyoxylate reductase [Bacillota bacterium]
MTGKILEPAQQKLAERCNLRIWDQAAPNARETLLQWLADAEGLMIRSDLQVDEELLRHAPNLRVIAQPMVGYDNVDIDACTRHGIPYGNTPGVLVDTTAELTFALMICAARRVHEGWDFVRDGRWQQGESFPYGFDLHGKTLGVVGMGQIGVAVATRAKAFGMKVIYNNRRQRPDDKELGFQYVTLDELLADADYIVVLTPLTPQSYQLFGAKEFAAMKPSAHFINVARGPVVDTMALYEALKDGQIAYAALDVTDPEPIPTGHPLLELNNILITPHIGSATLRTRIAMNMLAADNLLAGLERKPLPACVNPTVNYR